MEIIKNAVEKMRRDKVKGTRVGFDRQEDNRSSTSRQNIPQGSVANQILPRQRDQEENSSSASCPTTTVCDRKQTSGSDRGRQNVFKIGQNIICHVFYVL